MLASALPSCWATFATIASSSATDERHGALEALDLGRDLARIGEHLRLARPEHRVDSVRDPDHDARADCNSLVHNTLSLAKPRSLAQT